MERDHNYLYHCNGCDKADKNYPDKEKQDKETGEYQEKMFDPQEHFAAFDLCLQLRKWSSTRIPKYDLSIRGPDKR